MERLSLLVADDEAIIRRKVAMMLTGKFSLHEAATAEAARAAALKGHDAILLDIVFPDGNGIDLCREIKQQDPHSTVVISSSLESVDAWNQAFKAGADGYLEKRELLDMDPRKIVLMIANLVERNRLRKKAEETNRRQAELLSVLSHDVRAPFQALLGTIELLRNSAIPDDASKRVENLYHCAIDQLAFINSLLELLRLESDDGVVPSFPVDTNLVVNQCVQSLKVLAEAKEIILTTDLGPDLPRIDGDMAKLSQVMNNLIGNAIKFTPRKGKIRVSTGVLMKRSTPGVEIRVEDTGLGIKPEDRQRVFQRFRRGHSQGTEGERGTGLGLSICKQIVQLHGGSIEIADAKSGGTAVSTWFPVSSKRLERTPDLPRVPVHAPLF